MFARQTSEPTVLHSILPQNPPPSLSRRSYRPNGQGQGEMADASARSFWILLAGSGGLERPSSERNALPGFGPPRICSSRRCVRSRAGPSPSRRLSSDGPCTPHTIPRMFSNPSSQQALCCHTTRLPKLSVPLDALDVLIPAQTRRGDGHHRRHTLRAHRSQAPRRANRGTS